MEDVWTVPLTVLVVVTVPRYAVALVYYETPLPPIGNDTSEGGTV